MLQWKSRNITKHLISRPSGNQLVLFSLECWCFPRIRLGKHQDSRENKTNCFPRDLTLIYKCIEIYSLNSYDVNFIRKWVPANQRSERCFSDLKKAIRPIRIANGVFSRVRKMIRPIKSLRGVWVLRGPPFLGEKKSRKLYWNSFVYFTIDEENWKELAKQRRKGV